MNALKSLFSVRRTRTLPVPPDDAQLALFFFVKQKTAYEIGWCDWSSDVCSSDLERMCSMLGCGSARSIKLLAASLKMRSEERRVGKECTIQCRSRCSPYH